MRRVAVAGHVCLDLVPDLGRAPAGAPGELVEVGAMAVHPGGCVANTGIALSALGTPVTVHADIGSDDLGRLLVAGLRRRGLDPGPLRTVPGATTSYSLVVQRPGCDRTFWHHTGANTDFDGSDVDVESPDVLHVGYPSLLPALVASGGAGMVELLRRARAAGTTTSVDLAVVDPASPAGAADWGAVLDAVCAHTDVLSPSLADLTSALRIEEPFSTALVDRLAARLLEAGVAVVAISAGARGLFVRTAATARFQESGPALARVAHWAGQRLDVPPVEVARVATTNGAGDAGSAGLLHALLAGAGVEEAAALSVACSAAVVSGGRPDAATVAGLAPSLAGLLHPAPRTTDER